MRHILLIDPLEKLVVKKDSTLLFALGLKRRGFDVFLLFEEDFYFQNSGEISYKVYNFSGEYLDGGPYISSFELEDEESVVIGKGDTIHMRLDPPFDSRYLRILWMLKSLKTLGVEVLNSPEGIMLHNEKLCAYERRESAESFVGSSLDAFKEFAKGQKEKGAKYLILKPLDLYQGIGVQKIDIDGDVTATFEKSVKDYQGPVVAQRYIEQVESGEVRSIYFKGKDIGTILKVPKKGEFLANIAAGASYKKYEMNRVQKKLCDSISKDLATFGVDWIAFDILGDSVSEVNITCPGLLVEVSSACGHDLSDTIIDNLK